MAKANIPIYRDMVELLKLLLREVKNMPKADNRTLGDAIINKTLSGINHLQKAYDNYDNQQLRLQSLKDFDTDISTLLTYLRVVNELHLLPLKTMVSIFERTEAICKQLKGWMKKLVCEGASVTATAREQFDFEKEVPAHSH